MALVSFLFCVEEGVGMTDPNAAFVVKDEFMSELEQSLDHLPGMTVSSKKRFVKRLKLRFFSALNCEDSARPLASQFVEMVEQRQL